MKREQLTESEATELKIMDAIDAYGLTEFSQLVEYAHEKLSLTERSHIRKHVLFWDAYLEGKKHELQNEKMELAELDEMAAEHDGF